MTDIKNFAIVIPARYKSSRFPGKPLVNILGKTMIQHVWERCCLAADKNLVYIATDDKRIRDVAIQFGAQVVMTSDKCLTGTDRLAEVNEKIKCDLIINVQGDEPLVHPEDILLIKDAFIKERQIINGMSIINTKEEFFSINIPKVVTRINGDLLYISRSPVPINKSSSFTNSYKQVCIYAFGKEHLKFFRENKDKTPLESEEDIEILRFLENGFPIKMIEVFNQTYAVDIPDDLKKIEEILKNGN
ncbi:MAG: 3-deoxy-manno-octulosonate cytidylyltransferase [Rhodobiaceae bacterium]|nr:3-deoxy-manno-octulosonate cytidylyltransferase [Rhodobiaceae bacterium]|tara:strand:- start:19284 stop:20021 length:738 start_codon:yes stop_codon:yes gene_type:complete